MTDSSRSYSETDASYFRCFDKIGYDQGFGTYYDHSQPFWALLGQNLAQSNRFFLPMCPDLSFNTWHWWLHNVPFKYLAWASTHAVF